MKRCDAVTFVQGVGKIEIMKSKFSDVAGNLEQKVEKYLGLRDEEKE